ncbi:MAG: hypothetical protein ACE5DX_03375 [Candidatus Dojkabacteria bacterium]
MQDQIHQQGEKKRRFNLFGLLLKVLFSPLLIVVVGLFIFSDLRKAILATLLFITAWNVLTLLIDLLKLVFATATFNIIGFIKTSIDIVIAIFIIAIYWIIYIAVYGSNFGF